MLNKILNFKVLNNSRLWKGKEKISILLMAVFLILFPIIFSPSQYLIRIIIMIGIYSILALSLNIITGYLGQVSLGHAAFYAIGAYTSALLAVNFGTSFFISSIAGAVMAGFFGFILGLPTLRISGTYLVIATMGFAEIVKVVLTNWESVTFGAFGVQKIPRPVFFGIELSTANAGMYYLMLVILALVILLCYVILKSKMGRALRAINDDPLASSLMGIRINKYKVMAFTISAFIAGFAGALYAHMTRYIDPNTFSFDVSILILSIVIFGGMGSIKGMLLGAAVLISFPEFLRALAEYRFIIYGLILILMMRFRQQGLLGGLSKKPYKFPKGIKVNVNQKE